MVEVSVACHSWFTTLALMALGFSRSAFESVGIMVEEKLGTEFSSVNGGSLRIPELEGYGLG